MLHPFASASADRNDAFAAVGEMFPEMDAVSVGDTFQTSHLTDELYESKIVYRTEKFEDNVRTFCMNPKSTVSFSSSYNCSRTI